MRSFIERIVVGNNRNSIKCASIYNSIAGLMNAFQSIIFIMIATRLSTIHDAGNLTIAFAIGNLLLTLGKFGVRNYQVTDVSGKYKFSEYLCARKITTGIMFACGLAFCIFQFIFNDASGKKILTILLILIMYLFESYEDVYEAAFQRIGRLDISSMIYIIRWTVTYIVYGLIFIIFRNMILALSLACMMNGISCLLLIDICVKTEMINIKKENRKGYFSIIKMSTVLCLSSFFIMFIVNCPKYIIDIKMTSLEQTCFGIIVMPIFGIELLSNFIYQPYLHSMSQCIYNNEIKKLYTWMMKQIIYIAIMTVIILICANWVGIPILSFVYNIDLSLYHTDLLLVLVGGGFLACSNFCGVMLTLLRKQQYMMFCYFFTSIMEVFVLYCMVDLFGIRGAVISYDVVILLLTVMLLISLFLILKRNYEMA